MLKVLLCASEVAPIIKIGGLGDVMGSLPKALEKIGVDADVVVPYFPLAKVTGLKIYKSRDLAVTYNNQVYLVGVFATKLPKSNVDVFMLKSDEFFAEGGRDAFKNSLQETKVFSFFCRCVVELIKSRFSTYDVIHCNDWHTGLITHILEEELSSERPATIITIHNLSYQGTGDAQVVKEVGLDPSKHQSIVWDISDGDLNLLMQGIMSSDFINTVSPNYTRELLATDDGSKISEVLTSRKDRIIGILNGVDYDSFPRDYNSENWQTFKENDKISLMKRLGMVPGEGPVFSMISRLDPNQKGLELLLEAIPFILDQGGRFILLGSGNPEWEEKFKDLQSRLGTDKMSFNSVFDPELAISIYRGTDYFLVPSKFEPCGLTQMIAMWYGAVPVVHAVGGLRDTVKEGKTGFLFNDYNCDSLKKSLTKCFNIYKSPVHLAMIEAGLKEDFSFDRSARSYKDLYDKAVQIRKDAYGDIHL